MRRALDHLVALPPIGPALLCGAAVLHGRLPATWHRPFVAGLIVLGVASIAHGVARNAPDHPGWRRFTLGIAWYGGSDVVWLGATAALGEDHPVGTAVWLAGLPGVVLAIRGLRTVLASGDRAADREARVDAYIIALAVAYVGWHLTVLPLLGRVGWTSYAVIGSTPYWLMVVVALGLLLSRGLRGGAGTPSLWLLAAAIPLTGLTSVVYWTLEADVAWASAPVSRVLMALAFAAAAAAVGHPTMRQLGDGGRRDGPVWARLLLVSVGAAVVPVWHAMEAVGWVPTTDPVGGLLGLAITGLAIHRIAVTLQGRAAVEDRLRAREARFRSLVEHAYDSIAICDAELRIVWGGANTGAVTGRSLADRVGEPLLDEVDPEDRADVTARFLRCLGDPGRSQSGTLRVLTATGERRHLEYALTNRLEDPAVGGVVINYRDVTDTVVARRLLEHQATHDALTGLLNRAALTAALAEGVAAGQRPAVLFLDLDRFKVVNDSLGHPEGDRLLRAVADRLVAVVGDLGTVGRLGGDEFVVLLPDVDGEVLPLHLAASVCQALAEPVPLGDQEVATGASVGVAVHQAGQSPSDLLRDADTAMYRVKEQGRDGYVLFDPSWRGTSATRLRLETALRRALQEGVGLELHHQPVVSVDSGRVTGVEALLRWSPGALDDDGPPIAITTADLVRVAEESGLIGPLGDWVVRQACHDLARLDQAFPHLALSMAVNVSGAQLRRSGFAATVARALAAEGLAPSRLVVELTESVVLQDVAAAHVTLQALRADGVRLAMDDFGTGYSALANLKRFPFAQVKIDRSFVGGLCEGGGDRALVSAVVGMARALGMSVVAEGVETAGQLEVLQGLGCDEAQGWHLGRPMPVGELVRWLVEVGGAPTPTSTAA